MWHDALLGASAFVLPDKQAKPISSVETPAKRKCRLLPTSFGLRPTHPDIETQAKIQDVKYKGAVTTWLLPFFNAGGRPARDVCLRDQKLFTSFAVSHRNESSRTGIVKEASPLVDRAQADCSSSGSQTICCAIFTKGWHLASLMISCSPAIDQNLQKLPAPWWLEVCLHVAAQTAAATTMRCTFCNNSLQQFMS